MIIGTANGDAVMMDSITGTLLGLLRDCNPSVNGTCGNDQMLLSAEADRSFLHTWSLHIDQPKYRCQAPERIRCLACTADGTHCAGGGVSGKNYLWEVASGRLLAGWDAHFKPCTVITFVGADSFIVSAGEDAMIFLWSLGLLLHASAASLPPPPPLCTWSEHVLPINALCVAPCGQHDLLCSASADHSVRLWHVSERACNMLYCVDFPAALPVVAANPTGGIVYAGGADGHIFMQALVVSASTVVGHKSVSRAEYTVSASAHVQAVSGLAVSLDGSRVYSCAGVEGVWLWDALSMRLLERFQPQLPVECLMLMPKLSTCNNMLRPVLLAPLKKYSEAPRDLSCLQPSDQALGCVPILLAQEPFDEADEADLPLLIDLSAGVSSMEPLLFGIGANSGGVAELRAQVTHWQQLNRELYHLAVEGLLSEANS